MQLLYTSGTTALPKGAMMTHRALVHEYLSAITALDLSAGDRPVHSLPLYHSAQMHVFLLPYLAVGATNVILDAPDGDRLFDLIEQGRADSLFAPPTVWIGLANRPDFAERDLSGLRKAYYGASIMPVPVLERLRARLPELAFYNCFGQSEIGPLATVLAPDEHRGRMDSCGRPVLFVDARVVDEDGKEVPDGTPGEIVYRSPQLCEGYWDKPEETAEAFRDGWFRSGDLAVRDAHGYFTIVDRVKDVINSGGVLVASRQVEDALYTHEGVAEVAVVGLPDEKWIEAITAVVVPRGEVTEQELIAHARRGCPLQGAQAGAVRGRAAPQRQRQDPQAGTARPVRVSGRERTLPGISAAARPARPFRPFHPRFGGSCPPNVPATPGRRSPPRPRRRCRP